MSRDKRTHGKLGQNAETLSEKLQVVLLSKVEGVRGDVAADIEGVGVALEEVADLGQKLCLCLQLESRLIR